MKRLDPLAQAIEVTVTLLVTLPEPERGRTIGVDLDHLGRDLAVSIEEGTHSFDASPREGVSEVMVDVIDASYADGGARIVDKPRGAAQ